MLHKHLQSAINLAKAHTFDSRLGYTHCCLLVRGGSILSVGFNGCNANGFVNHLANMLTIPEGKPVNRHAEMAAILSVRSKVDLSGSKAFVARVKSTGVGISRPCELCEHALGRYGIKRAYYTINETEYGVMKL